MIWTRETVRSPVLPDPVPVIVARDIPYSAQADRFQNLSLYLPVTRETSALVGTSSDAVPVAAADPDAPNWLVHVHGGAWRDPKLTSASVEPTVAHAFSAPRGDITVIASLNYRLSQFPTHPTSPHSTTVGRPDPAREAVHPDHLEDVLRGLELLRGMGLSDGSYILSGHSCGACIALQAVLMSPADSGLIDRPEPPRPAAVATFNGLYDLPALVDGLDRSHEHLRAEYSTLLTYAFGDRARWNTASPARVDPDAVADRVLNGRAPTLVVADQSPDDQLVPLNQREHLQRMLDEVPGLRFRAAHRCAGEHAAPWQRGDMIWSGVTDTLDLLRNSNDTDRRGDMT